ncbi:MAG: Holliday junction resolvase RuvX [Patescibacteria group bacterium]
MKYLGLDYGEKRIGVAISDDILMFAHEYGIMDSLTDDNIIVYLRELIEKESITDIVVGMPYALSGDDTAKTQETREFAAMLEDSLPVRIHLQDERWTTKEADATLLAMGISQKEARSVKDMIAAKYILQTYMDKVKEDEEEDF